MPEDEDASGGRLRRAAFTRRAFLTGAGAAGGLAAASLASGQHVHRSDPLPTDLEAEEFPPLPPSRPPAFCTINEFFTAAEARVVEAISARILPGSPEDPGAREACVTGYIDHKLAEFDAFATPTYRDGPFPHPQSDLGLTPDEGERYGMQSQLRPQEVYRRGLVSLAAVVTSRHATTFDQLAETDQDALLMELEDGMLPGFDEPKGDHLFSQIRDDVIEGMFADPVYGGNAGLVGWKLIGYPGAQRGYTPAEVRTGRAERPPQGLTDLSHVHAGRPTGGDQVVQLPRRGVKG